MMLLWATTFATIHAVLRHQAPGRDRDVLARGGSNHADNGAKGRPPPPALALHRDRQCRGCGSPLCRALHRGKARANRVLARDARVRRWSAIVLRKPWNGEDPNGATRRPWPCEASHRTRWTGGSPTTSMAKIVRYARPRSTFDREVCHRSAPCSTPPGPGGGTWMGGPDGHDLGLHLRHVLVRQRRAFVGINSGRNAAAPSQGPSHLSTDPLR